MRFSTILESALQNKDRQQKELAEHLEVHASNISQYATGRTEPDFETMMKICQFLNIDLTAIYQIQHENPDAYIILDKNEKALIDTYRSLPKKLQTGLPALRQEIQFFSSTYHKLLSFRSIPVITCSILHLSISFRSR